MQIFKKLHAVTLISKELVKVYLCIFKRKTKKNAERK